MKVVILAGGLGNRISAKTYKKPNPVIKISDKLILGHTDLKLDLGSQAIT